MKCDSTSLDVTTSGGVWGDIWLDVESEGFPEIGWNDMLVPVLIGAVQATIALRAWGTPRISPDTGLQQTYRGSGAGLRQQGHWKDALEWDVPGTTYRILEQVDENGVPTGVLGYVLEHDYNAPFYFPAPWYPEGGVVPRRLGGPGR